MKVFCYCRHLIILLLIAFLWPASIQAAEGIVYAVHFQIPEQEGLDYSSPAEDLLTRVYFLDTATKKVREIIGI